MKKLNRFLYLLAFLKFILPFVLQNPVYEPHRDEFLYLAEGAHPAFGFMEVPPLLSVFAWLTRHLGNTMFWIKCWPSLFGALNFVLVGRLIITEGARHFALFLLFCGFFFTGFLRVHFLFQPNFLEIFFYTVIALGIIRYVRTGKNYWLYIAALGGGLGLLSKYSVVFYLISLVPALLLTRQRTIFLNRHVYIASALAFLLFLPNLIWQYQHHFPVVYHMHELTSTQLQYIPVSGFFREQILMLLPCCFIWITGFFYLLFNHKQRQLIFLCWAYLGVLIILICFHGKGYYALGLYPVLLGFGSLAIEKWTSERPFWFRYAIIVFILIPGSYFIFIGLPVLAPDKLAHFYERTNARRKGFLNWEDLKEHPLPQDFADMLGWDEMARKTADAFHSLRNDQQLRTIIFCDNYGMAGAINYYRKKYDLPESYSDNASFLYWIPDTLQFDNLILLEIDPNEMHYGFIKEFKRVVLTDSVTNPYAREKGTAVLVMTGASDQFRKFFSTKLEADRRKTQTR